MDFSFREINDLANKIKTKKESKVNESMIQLIENKTDLIEGYLKKEYEHRYKPIEAAIDAHKKQIYDLSIPVFLAQTDGICKEITGFTFFGSNRKDDFKPYTSEWVNQFETDSIIRLLLEPLRHKGGFNKHTSDNNFLGLTRHSVLHGIESNYGNQLISCKALSMLYYIANVVNQINSSAETLKNKS